MTAASNRVTDTARTVFGIQQLRPGQGEAVQALLEGHDVLLVQSTGAGKSLAYQLPAVLLAGLTLVVSPLLALQQDQIDRLESHGHRTRARRISSAESASERREALAEAERGEIEFLFLAPEQLANDETRAVIGRLKPSLLAVDEAHCVSSWGHDFRPDYLRLGQLLEQLGGKHRIIALTATAAPPVRADIVERLHLHDPQVVVGGTARDNITLGVQRAIDADEQRTMVLAAVREAEAAEQQGRPDQGTGIVYVRTRRAAEEYAELFAEQGRAATAYHAGLAKKVREQAHVDFTDGAVEVMVATSAFGMGIDKPDIRFVVHAQAPESPDEYYQQVGRAGRDGRPARGLLVYRPEDLALARFFSPAVPKKADVEAVLGALAVLGEDATRPELGERSGIGPQQLGRLLNLITESATDAGDGRSAVEQVIDHAEAYRFMQRSRIAMMRGYAETLECRRAFLLRYFGEVDPGLCGTCDNCRSGRAQEMAERADQAEEVAASPFAAQDEVRHEMFGEGTVMAVEGNYIMVLFAEVGYKTLSLPTVLREDLLAAT